MQLESRTCNHLFGMMHSAESQKALVCDRVRRVRVFSQDVDHRNLKSSRRVKRCTRVSFSPRELSSHRASYQLVCDTRVKSYLISERSLSDRAEIVFGWLAYIEPWCSGEPCSTVHRHWASTSCTRNPPTPSTLRYHRLAFE